MSTWQISESGTEVALDDQGRGEVTFLVTNTGDTQDRSVLTITALDGAGESWFAVEEPQRLVPPKDSAAYLCKVLVPAGTAAGTYAMQAVAYSADRDPGETSTTSRRVTLTVKATAPLPTPQTPWWAYVLTAVVLLTVIGVILFFVLKDDGLGNDELPAVTGTPEVLQVLEASSGDWSQPDDELTFAFQWQRCTAEGDDCDDIDGAVLPTYQTGADDLDRTLRVAVTAAAGSDEATAVSDATGVVAPAPIPQVPVPDVRGLPLDDAIATLSTNFQVVALTAGAPANNCNPPVASQSPDPGTILAAGEQVTITSIPRGGELVFCIDFRLPVLIEELPVFEFNELPEEGG